MIRFFYDVAAEAPSMAMAPNVAELMASQGTKTDGGENQQATITDIKTTPAAEAKAVETTAETAATNPAGAAAPPPAAGEPVKQPEPVRAPEPDWRELVKKQPETEVLKHLGFDDKMLGFIQNWKSGGDLKSYMEALTTDYTKMSPEDVMKHQLQIEYSDLPPEDFDDLYRMKVTEAYKLDTDLFSEQEAKRGRILLNVDAKNVRKRLIEEQQTYLLPKAPDKAAEVNQQAEYEKAVGEYKKALETDPYTKEVLNSKTVVIGDGEDKFNYTTETPDKLISLLYDSDAWNKALNNADGSPNLPKRVLMAAIAQDDKAVLKNLKDHFMAIGARNAIAPIENASNTQGTASKGAGTMTPAEALAKGGAIVSG